MKDSIKHYLDVRAIVRKASGESLDLKAYEADMRHLIDTYIEADEPRKISPFDNMGLLDLIVKTGIANAIAAQLGDKGFLHLHIYRSGLMLYMTWEIDTERALPDRTVRKQAEDEWERLTGDCFNDGWREVPLMFRLTDHAYKALRLGEEGAG